MAGWMVDLRNTHKDKYKHRQKPWHNEASQMTNINADFGQLKTSNQKAANISVFYYNRLTET